MKITLEFDSYEDAEDHLKGGDYYLALHEFKQWLRSEWKHGEHDEKEFKIVDKLYEQFNEIITHYKIDL
jgi:hypothetical protein